MKKYCYILGLEIPTYVLNATKIDGVTVLIPASNLFGMGGGWNGGFIVQLKNTIKQIGTTGKKVKFGIIFGSECGNIVYNNHPWIEFVRHHHNDPNSPPKPIKVPVPWDSGYLDKVQETIEWVSSELKKDSIVYSTIESISITGDNETTLEIRNTATDWTTATEIKTAYHDAAIKWINLGYLPSKIVDTNIRLVTLFKNCFPDKTIVYQYIGGLGMSPNVGNNGLECLSKQRPDIKKTIIDYGKLFVNFESMYTAYNLNSQVTDKIVQLEKITYNNSLDLDLLNDTIYKGETEGVEIMEFFKNQVRNFPQVFN